ncbi:MAG: rhodanese-like domain-containing protein [Acidobacteria bacterium]|nr:rhodanese-like domain-containing protein [Acidobacteriota bacterium]
MKDWVAAHRGKATIAGAVLIVCVFGSIGLLRNAVAEHPLAWVAKPPVLVKYDRAVRPSPDALQTVTLEDAAGMAFDAGALFVDARTAEEYAAGHIQGAVNLPTNHYDDELPAVAARLEGMTLIVYCDGGACEASLQVARRLLKSGYAPVVVFTGGWPEWQGAGYPTEAGGTPSP